jgi:beta-glucosidase
MTDIDGLLQALTVQEKSSLTAGADAWSLRGVERLGIPAIRVTDGHAGARAPGALPDELAWEAWGIVTGRATWVPCGSAVGATWDPAIAEEIGRIVGRDALDKGCRVLLAPTVNLHRALLAGRNFEGYSEDPLLSGKLAAGYVRGVQSNGVLATVKHLVGNEQEFERSSISSEIDQRTLRELYLLPFEIAVREGGALAVMTSYNRVNGTWVTEQSELLTEVLREEWGFRGLVMTDWSGAINATTSLAAGLDLEMPGPGQALGARVVTSIEEGLVDPADLDAAVRRLLTALDAVGALDEPTPQGVAQVPSGDQRKILRSAAADATVLLKNDGTLPLASDKLQRVVVIGEPGRTATRGGGGSSQLVGHRIPSPLEALREALGEATEVGYERGCESTPAAPRVGGPALPAPDAFVTEVFAGGDFAGPPLFSRRLETLSFWYLSNFSQGYPQGPWSVRIGGTVVPDESGPRRLVLSTIGPARLYVDGELAIDSTVGERRPFNPATWREDEHLSAEVHLRAGVPVDLLVEYVHIGGPVTLCRVGVRDVDADALLDRAVAAAQDADVAVVFVGTDDEWESEGYDRPSFSLPGRQDELVRRVAAANARTVVVVNSGAPVHLPWSDEVAALMHVWFGGEEMDGAIADVLTGRADPGGRLPVTIPRRIEHEPAHDNFPGENGRVSYGEGLFMGYRGYEHRAIEPLYAFGHGLSYTTFEIGPPKLTGSTIASGQHIDVEIPVTNTGARSGSEVVQCYVAPRASRLARPVEELKGFCKVRLEPGETGLARIALDERAFSYWDAGHEDWDAIRARVQSSVEVPATAAEARRGWRLEPGEYDLLLGTASDRIVHRVTVSAR